MVKQSAGILLYRFNSSILEVLLAHPGGPFWQKKDIGAWSIPKGEFSDNEAALDAAKREVFEELGVEVAGDFISLGKAKQPSGKVVYAWALKMDFNPKDLKCNLFSMEWPPKSGKQKEFPELDKVEWFSIEKAKGKILKGQVVFIDNLINFLGVKSNKPSMPGTVQLSFFD